MTKPANEYSYRIRSTLVVFGAITISDERKENKDSNHCMCQPESDEKSEQPNERNVEKIPWKNLHFHITLSVKRCICIGIVHQTSNAINIVLILNANARSGAVANFRRFILRSAIESGWFEMSQRSQKNPIHRFNFMAKTLQKLKHWKCYTFPRCNLFHMIIFFLFWWSWMNDPKWKWVFFLSIDHRRFDRRTDRFTISQ